MVMPLHPPKFSSGVRFAFSMRACAQLESYIFFPAFSSAAENASFSAKLSDALRQHEPCSSGDEASGRSGNRTRGGGGGGATSFPVHALVVTPNPRNPPVSKKLLAMHAAFSNFDIKYAIALDAESEFQSAGRFDGYFWQWSRRRQVAAAVLAATGGHGGKADMSGKSDAMDATISTESCGVVGLAPPDGTRIFSWWSDVPLYDRADFWDFLQRFDWARLNWYSFDHEAYMCYKVSVHGWRVVPTAVKLETQPAAAQRTHAPALAFLWSRDAAPERLLRFHTDRSLPNDVTVEPDWVPGAPCCTPSSKQASSKQATAWWRVG